MAYLSAYYTRIDRRTDILKSAKSVTIENPAWLRPSRLSMWSLSSEMHENWHRVTSKTEDGPLISGRQIHRRSPLFKMRNAMCPVFRLLEEGSCQAGRFFRILLGEICVMHFTNRPARKYKYNMELFDTSELATTIYLTS